MLGQAPVITGPHIHHGKIVQIRQNYKYWNFIKLFNYAHWPSKRPNCVKLQDSNLKNDFRHENMSKSLFGQLWAYLMNCNTHHQTCPRYSSKQCSSHVPKGYFWVQWSRGQAWSFARADRRMDGRTDGYRQRHYPFGLRVGVKVIYQIFAMNSWYQKITFW